MNIPSPFTIYDASAGSGKTFVLVKEFLKNILLNPDPSYYRHILAITFTNKAVAEMKSRIVTNLVKIAFGEHKESENPMIDLLVEETSLSKDQMRVRAERILRHLLHHYSNFSVETIDRFNHRLIRTFSRDLKLPSNFEVELDSDQLLSEAVDSLISSTGEDAESAALILEFALEKTDDDKSWDIQREILETAKLLTKENDAPHLASIKELSLADFRVFQKALKKKHGIIGSKIGQLASDLLQTFESQGLNATHFNRKYLYNHFLKLQRGDFNVKFNLGWQSNLGEKPLYPARVARGEAEMIDELVPTIIEVFKQTKALVINIRFLENILKNLVPLSVVSLVNQEIQKFKEERGILPIWEFNPIIHAEIRDQPAPYIYERLGERYRHFFIDEFQDTSQLQWRNLIPLIENALSQEYGNSSSGSLMLVGDAKQSIYRWRGGLPEQFIELREDRTPFTAAPLNRKELHINYRSRKQIITFNNDFFKFSSRFLREPSHEDLFKNGTQQKYNDLEGGGITIEFLEKGEKTDTDPFCIKVSETIVTLMDKGYSYRDICILTRTRKQGVNMGDYLMGLGIPVISSEILLLVNSELVNFLINTLAASISSTDELARVSMLSFIYKQLGIKEPKHDFLAECMSMSNTELQARLLDHQIDFDFQHHQALSLYDCMEYTIRSFKIDKDSDAYAVGFMEEVFQFGKSPLASKTAFLEFWELKKEKLAIASNPHMNAVQIMTIHKSKGLEFPVVIFPWADVRFHDEKNAKAWLSWDGFNSEQFKNVYLSFSQEVEDYNDLASNLYKRRRATQELDAMNLLYVALTRPVDLLYVYCEEPSGSYGEVNSYNKLFKEYLTELEEWNDGKSIYHFGEVPAVKSAPKEYQYREVRPDFISTAAEDHNLRLATRESLLWETPVQEAINLGLLVHETMAKILRSSDLDAVIMESKESGKLGENEISVMELAARSIVNHPELKSYFDSDDEVWTEREVFLKDGEAIRPDRIQIGSDNSAIIIDYKTGEVSKENILQIELYAKALEEMGLVVKEKVIIYYNTGEIIINKL